MHGTHTAEVEDEKFLCQGVSIVRSAVLCQWYPPSHVGARLQALRPPKTQALRPPKTRCQTASSWHTPDPEPDCKQLALDLPNPGCKQLACPKGALTPVEPQTRLERSSCALRSTGTRSIRGTPRHPHPRRCGCFPVRASLRRPNASVTASLESRAVGRSTQGEGVTPFTLLMACCAMASQVPVGRFTLTSDFGKMSRRPCSRARVWEPSWSSKIHDKSERHVPCKRKLARNVAAGCRTGLRAQSRQITAPGPQRSFPRESA